MSKKLIGLVGRARVGKDTSATYLADKYRLLPYAFALPVKEMLEPVFGDLFYSGDREQPIEWLGKSPRQLMQTLGTDWGRDLIHPDLWVLLAHQQWKKLPGSAGMVATDVRFSNEAEWVLREGGTLIEIVRPGAELVNSHSSEQADLSHLCDYRIENTGTIEQLHENLDRVVTLINGATY